MLKFLLILLIVHWVIKWLFKPRRTLFWRFFTNYTGAHKPRVEQNQGSSHIEQLIACPSCGTFFKKTQGVEKRGKVYCSRSCL